MVQCIQLCNAATPACIVQLQHRTKAVTQSNTSEKHMSHRVRYCKLYLCACVPYACLPAVMFYAAQRKLSFLIAVLYLVQYML